MSEREPSEPEPELPGIPPPPTLPWWRRPLRLLTKPKLPGWVFFLWLLIQQIPDWKHRIDFWLDASKQAGGYAGDAAVVIGSPYFGLGMAAIGVLWLAFVGEPQRGVQRHPWLPYVGWIIARVFFTIIVTTTLTGVFQIAATNEVTKRTEDRFWYLNPTQTNLLGMALDSVPEDQRFSITLEIPVGNAQASTMGENLVELFHQHGWSATGSTNFSLRADLVGINFAVALDYPRMDKDSPPHAVELMYIFNRAGIKYGLGLDNGSRNNSLVLAIGSRPPDW